MVLEGGEYLTKAEAPALPKEEDALFSLVSPLHGLPAQMTQRQRFPLILSERHGLKNSSMSLT